MTWRYLHIVIFTISLLSEGWQANAQVEIKGSVKDNKESPISNAVVVLANPEGNRTIAYQIADDQGRFKITHNSPLDTVKISVSFLGYESQNRLISNKNQQINFQMTSKEIELKEVVIKAPNLWMKEDTLNYNVANFTSKQDRYIGDILKRLPGVVVSTTGTIYYNGKPINKFYIEGLDLLENKYSIATNNIPADAVTNVQVIENHQQIKALKNIILSDQAAINLKLKNSKMNRPVGNVEVGTGWEPFLWNLQLFGMNIVKNRQTMLTYKTGNTGKDISLELTEHQITLENLLAENELIPSDILVPISFWNPPIKEQRYLFNKTHIVSVNNLVKIDENSQVRINVDYMNDERSQNIQRRNEYYFPESDSSLIIDEKNSLNQYNNTANLSLSFTGNASDFFLEDKLKLKGKWCTETVDVLGSNPVDQRFNIPLFYIENDFDLIKKTKHRILRFTSFTRYSNQPQQLEVMADSIPHSDSDEADQSVRRSVFFTNNGTSLGYALKSHSNLLFDLKLKAKVEDLDSEMNVNLFPESTLDNQLRWNQFDGQLTSSYTYRNELFFLNINLPLVYKYLDVNDLILKEKKHYDFVFADPNLSFRYKMDSHWETSLSYSYKNDIGDLLDLNQGIIQTNYRSFIQGSGILERRTRQSYSYRLSYRNPIDAFFANLTVRYMQTKSNLLNGRRFTGIYSISSPSEINNERVTWYFNLNMGKYLERLKTNVSLQSSYNRTSYEQRQQESIVPVIGNMFMLRPKIDIKVARWVNLVYEANIAQNRINYSGENQDPVNQITQEVRCFIFPQKQWELKLQMEYLYNDISSDQSVTLLFGDVGIKYKLKTVDLSLDWLNIFNKKRYSYTLFDGINTYYSSYNLRPMNILFNVAFKF